LDCADYGSGLSGIQKDGLKVNEPILVVEDDISINRLLCETLNGAGYRTVAAFSGSEAVLLLPTEKWQCIILDLMLPGKTGEEVLEAVREHSTVPVIALSARVDKESKLSLLTGGADDYITKPFDVDELLARVAIQLRHNEPQKHGSVPALKWLDINLDPTARMVEVGNVPMHLTRREFDILALLIQHPRQVFSRVHIFESVWQDDFMSDDKTVNVHISNLRTKLNAASPHKHIKAVWGVGFRLAE